MHRRRSLVLVLLACAAVIAALAAPPAALAGRGLPDVTGLTSPTHPSSDQWYANASPSFLWDQAAFVDGYAFSIDQDQSGDPGMVAGDGAQITPPASLFGGATGSAGNITSSDSQDMAIGDLNRDGVPDVVTVDQYGGAVDVLSGNGDGTFAAPVSYPTPTSADLPDGTSYYGPYAVTIGDFNDDQWPDVAVALDSYPGFVAVLLNNGDGTLGSSAVLATGGAYPSSVTSADLNGDGDADLVLTNGFYWDSDVAVLLGDGEGGFQAVTTYRTDRNPEALALVDVNGDGNLDAVTANEGAGQGQGTGSISVLLGDGTGAFAPRADITLATPSYALAVGDLNGDGATDLAAGQAGAIDTLLGNGDGTFQGPVDNPRSGGTVRALTIADLTGDGKADVAVGSLTGIDVLAGGGDGTLGAAERCHTGCETSLVVRDLDRDGRSDLAFNDFQAGDDVYVALALPPALSIGEGPLADGTWYFHVRTVDGDGHGGQVATLPVNIDTTAPASTIGGLDDAWHGPATIPVTIDAADPGYPGASGVGMLEMRLLWGGVPVMSWMQQELPVTDGAIHVSDSWEGMPDGVWTVETRATDAAGNVETSHGYTLKVDTTAPTVTLGGVSDGGTYGSAQTATLTASDPAPTAPALRMPRAQTGSLGRSLSVVRAGKPAASVARAGEPAPTGLSSGVASVSWRLGDSGAFTLVAGGTAQIPIALMPAGTRTYEYYSTDLAGNSSATASFTVTMHPAPPRAVGLNRVTIVRGAVAHLRYKLTDASFPTLACRLFVTQYGKQKLTHDLGRQKVGTTLTASTRIALKPGIYVWYVRVSDEAGSVGWSKGMRLLVVAPNVTR